MLRTDWLAGILLLLLGSCSVAVVGSAIHCIATGNAAECPRFEVDDKCVHATLGCSP